MRKARELERVFGYTKWGQKSNWVEEMKNIFHTSVIVTNEESQDL